MLDFIILTVIVLIIGSILLYIRRQKKRGVKCIGCPDSGSCASCGCCGSCSGCGQSRR